MGRAGDTITVAVTLSDDAGERTTVDTRTWNELRHRIEAIVNEERYEDICAVIV